MTPIRKILIVFFTIVALGMTLNLRASELDTVKLSLPDTIPACIRMHEMLVKYSQMYEIPFKIAYGIAHKETGYNGPMHWDYNPKLRNKTAFGAMQITIGTARQVWNDKSLTVKMLISDMELNVETAMKLLATLKKDCGTWHRALGCYNTGKPIVNRYARDIMKSRS
jgi:hypothetical protein